MASREEAPATPPRPLDDEGQATENATNNAIVTNIPNRDDSADEVDVANAAASTDPDEDVNTVTDSPPASTTNIAPQNSANLSTADLISDIVRTAFPRGVLVTAEEFDAGFGALGLTTASVLRSAPFTDAALSDIGNGNAVEMDAGDNLRNFLWQGLRAIIVCDLLSQLNRSSSDFCVVVKKVLRVYLEMLNETNKDGVNVAKMQEMLVDSVCEVLKREATHSGPEQKAFGNNKARTTKKREGENLEKTEAKRSKTSGKEQLEVEQYAEEPLAEEPAAEKPAAEERDDEEPAAEEPAALKKPAAPKKLAAPKKPAAKESDEESSEDDEEKTVIDSHDGAAAHKKPQECGGKCSAECGDHDCLGHRDPNRWAKPNPRIKTRQYYIWCHCPICEAKPKAEREPIHPNTFSDHKKAWGRKLTCQHCVRAGKPHPAIFGCFRDMKRHIKIVHFSEDVDLRWTEYPPGVKKPKHHHQEDAAEDAGDDESGASDAGAGAAGAAAVGSAVIPTPTEAQLDRDFPNGRVNVPTPGTNRLCGLYALRNSMAQLRYTIPGLAVPTIQELVRIFFHPDVRAFMRANGHDNNADLTADQVAVVLGRWAELHGINLQLGVVGHGIAPYLVPVPSVGIHTIVWIHNNGVTGLGAHWNGLATMERDWQGMMAEADEQTTDDVKDNEQKIFVAQLIGLLPGTTLDTATTVYAAIVQGTPSASYDDRLAMAFEFLGVSVPKVEEEDVKMDEGGQVEDEKIAEHAKMEDVEGEE